MADKTYHERVEAIKAALVPMRFASECADIASEADAELAACRLRIAELEAVQPSALKEKLRSAEARIAELEKDAARYRWLRDKLTWGVELARDVYDVAFDPPPAPFGSTWSVSFTVEGYGTTEAEDSLDAAIDAALNSKKESE